jgi:thioredoxin 1
MSRLIKFVIPVAVFVIAVGLILLKEKNRPSQAGSSVGRTESAVSRGKERSRSLPRLIDLGSGKCIPCKKMAPILEEIREEYRGVLDVEFIDVWKDRAAGPKYGIRLIPTQIFYDSIGRELTRHEGFMGKEDILGTFRRFGIKLEKPGEK